MMPLFTVIMDELGGPGDEEMGGRQVGGWLRKRGLREVYKELWIVAFLKHTKARE